MHKSPEPQPLTRLNVTKHDRIWDKEVPKKGFFGFDHSNSLFSPPLKHITPESTQELWEKFDPLDLLFDSASEKSVKTESSSDTMIMMTSEELKKNEERIKNSFKEYEHRKNLQTSQMNKSSLKYEGDLAVQQSDYKNNNSYKTTEEDFLNDEGYGTDSRTNTTASLSSPLSSSLSSLLTSESSSSQGSMQRNLNGTSRSQQIPSNGRLVVGNRQNVVPRKKVQPVEKQDNSLMEKLRALTTIQEEDVGNPDAGRESGQDAHRNSTCSSEQLHTSDGQRSVEQNMPELNLNEHRYVGDAHSGHMGRVDLMGQQNPVCPGEEGGNIFIEDANRLGSGGIFRAVPVNIRQRNSVSQMENISDNRTVMYRQSHKPQQDSMLRNCDAAHSDSRLQPGDNSGFVSENSVPQKLSKHPSYMYSMPNLAADSWLSSQTDQVVLRRPKLHNHNLQTAPTPEYRFSWDCSSDINQVHSKFEVSSRNFYRNEDRPKLKNQFHASSEMALQNGRALFAPSSDIYKLFQGQGHTGFSQGKQASHRHSFHVMPSQTFSMQSSDPSTEELRNRLRAATSQQNSAPAARVKTGPVRANHQLHKYSSHNTDGFQSQIYDHKPRPSSMAETKDKLSTLV